jgi:short-subunit dehydrogenase
MSNVLILGATSDIATAIASKFAAEKYDLSLAARNIQLLMPIKKDLEIRYQNEVDLYTFDAIDFESHFQFFQNLKKKPEITICVFGLMEEEDQALESWQVCKKMIDTNYVGAVSILNIIARHYIARKSGTIVGISSVAGERGRKSKLIYGSSKAAFSAYLAGLRNLTYNSNVQVVSVKPGFVDTKMTEELKLPPLLTAKPELVAIKVYKGVKKGKNVIYVKWVWRYIMLIIKLIPERIFKKMNL